MRMRFVAGLLFCGWSPLGTLGAQAVDPTLVSEVAAVGEAMASSRDALRQYTWIESTEVLVNGSVKTTNVLSCHYDGSGELIRTPVDPPGKQNQGNAVSKRPLVRSKAGMEDYIRRAISQIREYVPPKPEEIRYLLQNGFASQGQSASGHSELRFTNYFQRGDSLVFTYDSVSKALLHAGIASNLANPKDPVTLDAVFETLPDGVNHVGSATLNAKKKNVQVKLRNEMYQKLAN